MQQVPEPFSADKVSCELLGSELSTWCAGQYVRAQLSHLSFLCRSDKLLCKPQQCSQRSHKLSVQAAADVGAMNRSETACCCLYCNGKCAFVSYFDMQGAANASPSKQKKGKKSADAASAGASSVSSGVKLENVSIANPLGLFLRCVIPLFSCVHATEVMGRPGLAVTVMIHSPEIAQSRASSALF